MARQEQSPRDFTRRHFREHSQMVTPKGAGVATAKVSLTQMFVLCSSCQERVSGHRSWPRHSRAEWVLRQQARGPGPSCRERPRFFPGTLAFASQPSVCSLLPQPSTAHHPGTGPATLLGDWVTILPAAQGVAQASGPSLTSQAVRAFLFLMGGGGGGAENNLQKLCTPFTMWVPGNKMRSQAE